MSIKMSIEEYINGTVWRKVMTECNESDLASIVSALYSFDENDIEQNICKDNERKTNLFYTGNLCSVRINYDSDTVVLVSLSRECLRNTLLALNSRSLCNADQCVYLFDLFAASQVDMQAVQRDTEKGLNNGDLFKGWSKSDGTIFDFDNIVKTDSGNYEYVLCMYHELH